MALSPNDLRTLLNLFRSDPEARRQFQSILEMDALLELPASVSHIDQRLDRLVEIVTDLGAAQRRTEERVNELTEAVHSLAGSVEKLIDEVSGLGRWQRGEAGRREGEQYEKRILRNAVMLLNRGQGGAPEQSVVQERLSELFSRLPDGELLPDDESPSLADIVWWKGDAYAVVEVSVKVDASDVIRAARRAESLRHTGVGVIPIVIGEEWASPDTEERAQIRAVEWKVGNQLSPGLIAYRRLAA